MFRDVTGERLRLNEIQFLSFHDHLTELYNRRFLEAELSRQDESEKLPITLVMGDLNGLKMTNDAFGHYAGDDLLRRTAAVLKRCFRRGDIISRYGGDEFVVLMPNTTSQAAEVLVKKALSKIRDSKTGKGILSVSFGWDTKTDNGQSISQVLKNAEDNMIKRKLLESPSNRSATINAIVKTLYEKNSREEAHSKRVSKLSSAIGQAMGLKESEIDKIKTAGLLHDIGKITISNEVLEKRGPLEAVEWEEIKHHPETAYRILCGVAEMADLAETVRQHHERWDGKGYPRGLSGEEITLAARIICVADSFDAMTSERPYRSGMPVQEAREELRRQTGTQFDPEVVRVFLDSGLA
jgi:diguanylate cyclase (GGDEF)-like protein/putative nucleotidyltransferase with HDIG domain